MVLRPINNCEQQSICIFRLANEPIDNISARKKIRFRPLLRLRYDTTPTQLKEILDNIRSLLDSDPQVLLDGQRVRFMEISDDGLIVEVNSYLNTTDWATYLEMAEVLNLQIMQIISGAKTSLSAPARTLYLDSGGTMEAPEAGVGVA